MPHVATHCTRVVGSGPPPRSRFAVGENVIWFVVIPGFGDGVATRSRLTGRVVELDASHTQLFYIVKHASSGAEFRRAACELILDEST